MTINIIPEIKFASVVNERRIITYHDRYRMFQRYPLFFIKIHEAIDLVIGVFGLVSEQVRH